MAFQGVIQCAYVCTSLPLQLFYSPFAVVLDHQKKSVVVAIRGSLSMEVSTGGTGRCFIYVPSAT